MNNYEIVREKLGIVLSAKGITEADRNTVLSALDVVMHDYDLTVKETGITVYNGNAIEDVVNYYILAMKNKRLSDGTLRNRHDTLMRFFEIVGKHPADVEHNDIYIWQYKLMQDGVAPNTMNTYMTSISAFFQWAVRRGIAKENPILPEDKNKCMVQEKLPLSDYQIGELRKACDECGLRARAVFEVLLSSGMRRAEAVDAKIEDICLDRMNEYGDIPIRIPCGKGAKERYTFISAYAYNYLKDYLDHRTDDSPYLFVTEHIKADKMSTKALGDIFLKLADKTGFDVTPHTMRRTFATSSVHNGTPINAVSRMMGHASINTTMIYAKDTIETLQEAFHTSHTA